MLVISAADIKESVPRKEIIKATETALVIYAQDRVNMPDRSHVSNRDSTLLLMPCFTDDYFSTKLVSVFPKNSEKGLEVIQGCVVLNDGTTGEPLAIIEAASLTAHRTGALGGVAAKYLSHNRASTLGVIGTGVQGFHQCLYISEVRNVSEIFLYNKSSEKVKPFVSQLRSELPEVKIHICDGSEEVVLRSEIIVTATSSSSPVIPNDPDLYLDKTIIAVGSYTPQMREIPQAVLEQVIKIYVDTQFAQEESGDLAIPLSHGTISESNIVPLGQLILHPQELQGNTQYFKSVGMAVLDLCSAIQIYEKAIETGFGTKVEF